MQTRYPAALWRPLGAQSEPSIGNPRILIFHTMVGTLAGTDAMFHRGGYGGTESTFGVGGSWDGDLDGVVYQWQDTAHAADAQWDGNSYANSVETSDGARSPVPDWSLKQVTALIRLSVWWCLATGNPARMVSSPADRGFGYHRQFPVWNKSAHECPGNARIAQLVGVVVPAVQVGLASGDPGAHPTSPPPGPGVSRGSNPHLPLRVDGDAGPGTYRALQWVLKLSPDGVFGPGTKKALQQHLHVTPDGVVGPTTVRALQRHVGSRQDGRWGADTTSHLQLTLNAGRM